MIGIFTNLFMLCDREAATSGELTSQLPKVQIYHNTPARSANNSVSGTTAFTSSSHD